MSEGDLPFEPGFGQSSTVVNRRLAAARPRHLLAQRRGLSDRGRARDRACGLRVDRGRALRRHRARRRRRARAWSTASCTRARAVAALAGGLLWAVQPPLLAGALIVGASLCLLAPGDEGDRCRRRAPLGGLVSPVTAMPCSDAARERLRARQVHPRCITRGLQTLHSMRVAGAAARRPEGAPCHRCCSTGRRSRRPPAPVTPAPDSQEHEARRAPQPPAVLGADAPPRDVARSCSATRARSASSTAISSTRRSARRRRGPTGLSTKCDYTSWSSLTDKSYSARQLPPAPEPRPSAGARTSPRSSARRGRVSARSRPCCSRTWRSGSPTASCGRSAPIRRWPTTSSPVTSRATSPPTRSTCASSTAALRPSRRRCASTRAAG